MTAVSSTITLSSLPRPVASSAPRAAAVVAVPAVPVKTIAVAGNAVKPDAQSATEANNSVGASAIAQAARESEIQELQLKMDKLNPELAFVVDESSGKATIQLTDRTTKEVIRQFPTEAAKQISKALDRFEKGQLLNLKV